MRNRHPYENRYCAICRCTTKHEVKDLQFACQRCGVVKYPSRPLKPVQSRAIPA